jgi:hypothetical protein
VDSSPAVGSVAGVNVQRAAIAAASTVTTAMSWVSELGPG